MLRRETSDFELLNALTSADPARHVRLEPGALADLLRRSTEGPSTATRHQHNSSATARRFTSLFLTFAACVAAAVAAIGPAPAGTLPDADALLPANSLTTFKPQLHLASGGRDGALTAGEFPGLRSDALSSPTAPVISIAVLENGSFPPVADASSHATIVDLPRCGWFGLHAAAASPGRFIPCGDNTSAAEQ